MVDEVVKHGPANPHPGFGKDDNIANEYGHTHYPKMIGDKIVNSKEEEAELNGEDKPIKAPPKGWKS